METKTYPAQQNKSNDRFLNKTGLMKVLPNSFEKNSIVYKEGLIVDHESFNPVSCKSGGLHYCEEKYIMDWFWVGDYVADVTIPSNAKVVTYTTKAKASSIILSNIRRIADYIHSKYPMKGESHHPVIMEWLRDNYRNLRHIKYQTPSLCRLMLSISPYSIEYIHHKTEEYWMMALKKDGSILHLLVPEILSLKNPWSDETVDKFFRTAIQDYGYNITFIPARLMKEEYKIMAVKATPNAICCIHNPSPDLCLQAVKLNYNTLIYVNRTKELCLEAIKQSLHALPLIPHSLLQDNEILGMIQQKSLEMNV